MVKGYGESILHKTREKVLLVYNGLIEIEANRYNVANSSCFFLNRILAGPFRESSQSRIDIYLDDVISFEVFEGIVKYADTREFNREHKKLRYYLVLIQLANMWLYDELVGVVETHLIEFIEIKTIAVLHTLANTLKLNKLIIECMKFEKELDHGMGTPQRGWPRCALAGHQTHHYHNCATFSNIWKVWDKSDEKEEKITKGILEDLDSFTFEEVETKSSSDDDEDDEDDNHNEIVFDGYKRLSGRGLIRRSR